MKRAPFWLLSAFAGFTFIFLLNASPLGSAGLGLKIPFGWSDSDATTSGMCIIAVPDQKNSTVCGGDVCDRDIRSQGLPFATSRPDKDYPCYDETNTTALVLNYILGIIIVPAAAVYFDNASNRNTSKK